jgi:hypothetical protein
VNDIKVLSYSIASAYGILKGGDEIDLNVAWNCVCDEVK